MASRTARVALLDQEKSVSTHLSFGISGSFNDFLPIFKIPISLVYLGMDEWLESVSKVVNQKILIMGGDSVALF